MTSLELPVEKNRESNVDRIRKLTTQFPHVPHLENNLNIPPSPTAPKTLPSFIANQTGYLVGDLGCFAYRVATQPGSYLDHTAIQSLDFSGKTFAEAVLFCQKALVERGNSWDGSANQSDILARDNPNRPVESKPIGPGTYTLEMTAINPGDTSHPTPANEVIASNLVLTESNRLPSFPVLTDNPALQAFVKSIELAIDNRPDITPLTELVAEIPALEIEQLSTHPLNPNGSLTIRTKEDVTNSATGTHFRAFSIREHKNRFENLITESLALAKKEAGSTPSKDEKFWIEFDQYLESTSDNDTIYLKINRETDMGIDPSFAFPPANADPSNLVLDQWLTRRLPQ